MKDDRPHLLRIAECILRIALYTAEGREAFRKSCMIQDAVLRNLELISEAARRISKSLKRLYPDVPWRRFSGLRHVLIHPGAGLARDEVWNAVERNLPELRRSIEKILRSLEENGF